MDADSKPTVYAVDNDLSTTNFVRDVAERMNVKHKTYTSGMEFLETIDRNGPGCVVLAVRIADISGPQIQRHLVAKAIEIPVIFVTAQASVPVIVRVMREGAISVLEKPIVEQELWETLQEALRVDVRRRRERECEQHLKTRFAAVTVKEREVLKLLLEGRPKKQIAETLDISIRTVELRRNSLMRKLHAHSFVELVQIGMVLGNGFAGALDCRLCPVSTCPKRPNYVDNSTAPLLDRHDVGLDLLDLD